ncbi:hypothetical protein [Snuella sedimenti]|uniref:Uncharacterized protein n=1 Tax=Snuella sedimenti TaxID=2798802 RepID=A0A8J7JDW6_9FLAO|nr:hypothetical protein [Snuella sedimenti]MBJ6369424.1 hypothetical protein [Snuella sedimenti]
MLKFILIAVAVILVTIGLVKLVDKFIPLKFKPFLTLILWLVIGYLGYQTYMSIYEPIQFNKEKNKRYAKVIKSLIDIRDAQLAHKQVTGRFTDNFDNLIKFVDTAEFTITQRRDTSVLDVEMTKRYGGVPTYKDEVIIDTLGFVPVKDSLFKNSTRYQTMMNIPVGKPGSKFELKAGFIEQNDVNIPVFEAAAKKDFLFFDQDKDLLNQEKQVISTVVGVTGDAIKVGSMEEVTTSGNWPKTYGDNE